MKQEFVQEGMRTYLKIEGDDLENVGDKMFSYRRFPVLCRWRLNGWMRKNNMCMM